MLMTPMTRRAEVKTPSRLPPPKEIGSAAGVHGAFAGRATRRGFVISRLGRLRRSYHHPLQTAFPCQWLVSAPVGPPIACSIEEEQWFSKSGCRPTSSPVTLMRGMARSPMSFAAT